ncbi:alcohol dehydrogenase catalytic domain-containing protein [uncultured Cohaesibacter sp.]|uniref:zinc-dependent alcohol dehydrogenase n=1 Tax=uncultured Cohaesibacter sp. TaxID=1002546 RepID=UPI002AAB9DB0|nr:alcohol dehydrogenase catalytic domain-containing protein [uncultured Cohaesibacter sp.]
MKAALVVDTEKVEIQDVPEPELKDDDVLIKVKVAGVCGSDLHLFKGTHAFRKPPAVLGHEVAGDVVKVGSKVTKFKEGDRVTVLPQVGCGECEFCKQDLVNLCLNKKVPGTPNWIGTFVEYFNAPEETVFKLEDSVTYEIGSLTEPLAVAVHALARASMKSRDCVVILGTGTIGMLCVVAAREMGFKKIITTDTAPFNREMSLRQGAIVSYDPLKDDVEGNVKKLTDGRGADLTLVCAGAPNILDQASACTRRRGEIGLVAMITKPIPFYCYSTVFNEQTVYGAMTYETCDFVKAAEMVNGGVDLSAFVTQRLPLDQTQEALDILNQKKEDVIKVVVTF